MADRLTTHKGYRGQNGKAYNSKHNQREGFEKEQGDTPAPENVYWDFTGESQENTFSENEKRFYRKSFGGYLKRKNQNAKDRRQYGRMETMERYKEKHPPEETLLYIGTKNVNPEVLREIFEDFLDWQVSQWKKDKGGFRLLNAALHNDEKTPHIQFRGVYMYADKNGDWQVSQNKALEILGYERPDLSKPVGRMNNAKITYTAKCREMLFEIAKEHGVELETEPLPKDEVGLPLKDYIQREQAREAAVAEQQAAQEVITGLQSDIADLEDDKADVSDELERLRRSAGREKAARDEKREAAEKQANEIIEQAKRDAEQLKIQAWELGAKEGAASAMARLNRLRQAATETEQAERDIPRL